MDDADAILVRAWRLAFHPALGEEGWTELESLLPALAAAGYVELGEDMWTFTSTGVARLDALLPDDPEQ